MKFTVVRDEWLKGNEEEESKLESEETGKKCCLGFFGLAAGVEPEHLSGIHVPSDLEGENLVKFGNLLTSTPEGVLWETTLCNQIMVENDKRSTTEHAREVCLQELFKKAGHEVEFMDTWPD